MEDPLSWSRHAGYKPYWIEDSTIAISPMPRPEDLEEIANTFRTVVSLAAPAEFVYGGHVDPRSLQAVAARHVWLLVGEYNAPTLPELAWALGRASETPVLVHCLRGCGRSPLFAAAWLLHYRGMRLQEALLRVRERRGCGLETLPQLSVLEAYDLALRAGLAKQVEGFDRDDARPEYSLLLARRLAWLAGKEAVDMARESLAGGGFWRAADVLARELGYTVAGMSTDKSDGRVVLRLVVWVTRRAHPASVRQPPLVPGPLAEKLSAELSSTLGRDVEAVFAVKKPTEVPWL